MGGFFEAALGFPAVVFTVLLAPVVAYWLAVMLGALEVDELGADGLDAGVDAATGDSAPGDAGNGDGGDGLLEGWWQGLGLGGVPLTIAISLVIVFGWMVAFVATAAADSMDVPPVVRLLGGLVVVAGSLIVGVLVASVAARPLGRLFVTTEAEGRGAFVGRTCTIRTVQVTDSFGQAEAADPSGATVLVQVRVPPASVGGGALARGEQALIFDYDPVSEVFLVCPVDDALGAGADGPS